MSNETYIAIVAREFAGLKSLADKAVAQLTAEQFFAKPRESDNSIAILMKHVSGNMRSRWTDFLTSDGEKADRKRDAEFIIMPDDTRENLLAKWDEAWALLFAALQPLTPQDLERSVMIRGEPLTVLQAVNRQLTHYAYHVGQIVYVAKHLVGAPWKTLSIAVGASDAFNQAPQSYLKRT